MAKTREIFAYEAQLTGAITAMLENYVARSKIPKRRPHARSIWDIGIDEENNTSDKSNLWNADAKISPAGFKRVPNNNNNLDGIWNDVVDLKYPPRYKFPESKIKSADESVKDERMIINSSRRNTRDLKFNENRNLEYVNNEHFDNISYSRNNNLPLEKIAIEGSMEKIKNDDLEYLKSFKKFYEQPVTHCNKENITERVEIKKEIFPSVPTTLYKEKEVLNSKELAPNEINTSKYSKQHAITDVQNKNDSFESMDVLYSKMRRMTPEKNLPRKKKCLLNDNLQENKFLEDTILEFALPAEDPNNSSLSNSLKIKADIPLHNIETNKNLCLDRNNTFEENVSQKTFSPQSNQKKVNSSKSDDLRSNFKSNLFERTRHVENKTVLRNQNWRSPDPSEPSKMYKRADQIKIPASSSVENKATKNPTLEEWLKNRNENFKSQKSVDLTSNKISIKKVKEKNSETERKIKSKAREKENVPVSDTCLDNSMVTLQVSGLSKGNELTVPREMLQHVKSSYPKLARMIPKDNTQVNGVPFSAEAVIIILKFLFAATYSISNSKIALEVLSISRKYGLSRLQSTCVQYLADNPPTFENVEEVIHYANHFHVLQDLNKITKVDGLSLYQALCENPQETSFKIPPATCSILNKIYIEPSEFCLPLQSIRRNLNGAFERDISNNLVFQSMKGSFSLTGVQIKLDLKSVGNKNVDIVYSVVKGEALLIDDAKRKNLRSLIILKFTKDVIVKSYEKVEIRIMIEDIKPSLCSSIANLENGEKAKNFGFITTLTSNHSQSVGRPLIFIEKIFYNVGV